MAAILNESDTTRQVKSSFSTANSCGVRLPSELCGRSVLYSMRHASMTLRAMREAQEPVLVQAFVTELAVEAFNVVAAFDRSDLLDTHSQRCAVWTTTAIAIQRP
jgi:hypothetical protein